MIGELALSRQGFEEILLAKNKELEVTKVYLINAFIFFPFTYFHLLLLSRLHSISSVTGGKGKGKSPKRGSSYTSDRSAGE